MLPSPCSPPFINYAASLEQAAVPESLQHIREMRGGFCFCFLGENAEVSFKLHCCFVCQLYAPNVFFSHSCFSFFLKEWDCQSAIICQNQVKIVFLKQHQQVRTYLNYKCIIFTVSFQYSALQDSGRLVKNFVFTVQQNKYQERKYHFYLSGVSTGLGI